MAQYKCLSEDFLTLDSKIKRIIKKLDKYKLSYVYTVLNETVETISIYNADNRGKTKISTANVKVTNYIFEMESIKLGNYEVIAILDHTTQNESCRNNMVYISNSEIELPHYYYTATGNCQHCNSNRKRNTTAVLYSTETNEFKQVGITCLKEYTGIDCLDVIRGFTDIYDIINDIDKCNITSETRRNYKHYTKVTDYLAKCIYLINQKGYVKDDTKNEAFELEEAVNDKYYTMANEVMSFFESTDFDNLFMTNIKTALAQEAICYSNGFIAYAYVAYKRELEKQKELEEKRANQVGFYGEVGKRETFTNLKIKCITHYESCFGYNEVTTYVYKMVNELGFIFIWKTQKFLLDINFIKELKGTIKTHSEYKGELQTELTRCKVVV